MKSFKDVYRNAENKIAGIAAAPGIVIGEVYLFTKEKLEINDADITDVKEAKKNLLEALEKSKKEFSKIFAIAKEKMGETRAGIFEAQLMIHTIYCTRVQYVREIQNLSKCVQFSYA